MTSILFLSLLACVGDKDSGAVSSPPSQEPMVQPVSPSLRRLTIAQYRNVITDVFGPDLLISNNLEPDIVSEGFRSLGAGISSLSPVGVERYESSSFGLAEQITNTPERLAPYFPCDLEGTPSSACLSEGMASLGLRLWRRPITEVETARLTQLINGIIEETDTLTGIQYLISAMLQSPFFLYRVEMNTTDSDEILALDDWAMASRLSFFFWNTGPDEVLLTAARDNTLSEPDVLEAQVDRMIGDDKFEQGVENFFDEMLHLYDLDGITKDPLVFSHASPDLYASAKEETLRTLKHIVNNDIDFRDVLTTQTTFIDRRLGTLYGVPAPNMDGFGEITLPESSGRRGLLTQASMLNLHAHATASSPTLRGVFIRKTLLCQMVPPPPADVDTSIPEATDEAPTMRLRLEQHFEDPSCAGCHKMMDLVGLGLENFDGIGQWRDLENNHPIDPSGNIDGSDFTNAWGLGEVVSNHPNLGPCLSDHLYSYALGHRLGDNQDPHKEWLTEHLQYSEWSFKSTMKTIALSEAFKTHGPLEATSSNPE